MKIFKKHFLFVFDTYFYKFMSEISLKETEKKLIIFNQKKNIEI